jgi:endoglycosylceramidase
LKAVSHHLHALCAASLLALAGSANAGSDMPRLHTESNLFKDEAGRVVLLRGVNVATDSKVPPFVSIERASQLDLLQKGGMNAIRLLFIWEPFEPNPGQYNQSYLDQYAQVVRWAAERGMYVIVNFHQDGFSRFSMQGCGDGFPIWALPEEIAPLTPDNNLGCKNWGPMVISDKTLKTTWDGFYKNTNGAYSRYKLMTQRVVQQLKQYSNVIGYDVMNEPGGAEEQISTMYKEVGEGIRQIDPQAVLFFIPPPLSSSGLVLDKIPNPGFSNASFAPHFYDPLTIALRTWGGTPSSWYLGPMLKKASTRQSPMFLGEFGAHGGTLFSKPYMEQLYTWLDTNFVSGAQWGYNPRWTPENMDGWNREDLSISSNDQFRPEIFVPRAYPSVTAGTPVAFKRSTNGLTYSWKHNPKLGDTVIFLPEQLRSGRQITVTPQPSRCFIDGASLKCSSSVATTLKVTIK